MNKKILLRLKMTELGKIKDYELLNQKVYRILKEKIVKGDLKPGEKLLENKLAEQLGVSRTPVREALQRIATEGLAKMTPNMGMVIIEFSLQDLHEVLEIRRLLEGFATFVAAQKTTTEELQKLEKILKEMKLSIFKEDAVAYSDLNAEFHSLLFKICGNKRLEKIYNDLTNADHRVRIRALRNNTERLKYSLKEHQEIVEALKKRDAGQAGKLSQQHIENVWKNILEYGIKEEEISNNA